MVALLMFSLDPIRFWSRVARVDMLACALELMGVYFGLRAIQRRGQLHGAGFCFVAAMFTKQTILLGAVATFSVALLHDWRRALGAAVTSGTVVILVVAALSVMTHGGFLRHLTLIHDQPVQCDRSCR